MRCEPRQPRGRVGESQHTEPQGVAGQRASHRRDGDRRAVASGRQLFGHVVDDAGVGRCGGGQHRRSRGQLGEKVSDPAVVGSEVVAPVADAVRLVDDQEPAPLDETGQHLVAETWVGQALGRHEQHVDLVGVDARADLTPLGGVGRAQLLRAHSRPRGCGDLVAHQGQQRRDQQRRSGTLLSAQRGRDEVHRRLAPPRPLHDEGTLATVDECLDGFPLTLAKLGLGTGRQRAQDVVGTATQVGNGEGRWSRLDVSRRHPPHLPLVHSGALLHEANCTFTRLASLVNGGFASLTRLAISP